MGNPQGDLYLLRGQIDPPKTAGTPKNPIKTARSFGLNIPFIVYIDTYIHPKEVATGEKTNG